MGLRGVFRLSLFPWITQGVRASARCCASRIAILHASWTSAPACIVRITLSYLSKQMDRRMRRRACHRSHYSTKIHSHIRAFHRSDRTVGLSTQNRHDSPMSDVGMNVPPDRTSPHPSLRQHLGEGSFQNRMLKRRRWGRRGHSSILAWGSSNGSSNQYLVRPA